jgi:hypothetical protein
LIEIDKNYFRPNEVHSLRGDFSKAKRVLGWKPKNNLDKMIKEMGGECVFRKTDCAVVIGGKPVIEMEKDEDNIMKTWGSFRNETFENIKDFNYEKKMKSNRHIEPIYLNQSWNTLAYNSSRQYKEIIV